MNTLKYILFASSIAVLLFQSCDEGSFSQVVTIEVPEHEPLPVVRLQIVAEQERALSTLISNSKGILDPESVYELPDDAEVNLYREGELYADFEFYENTLRYEYFTEEPFPSESGVKWELEANIPGFDPVLIEQIMPPKAIVKEATYEVEGTIDAEGYRVDELIVDIEDAEPGVTNYYGLALVQTYVEVDMNGDTIQESRSVVGLDTNDPLLSYSGNYQLVFNDDGFANNEYQVRAYTYYTLGEEVDLVVVLYQLTEDAWLHARSLQQYNNAIDNPFAEPVTVHSNVEGGFGVFTLSNQTEFLIEQ